MPDPKEYRETRKVKKGNRTTKVESYWSGPEIPRGEGRPGHFSKDPEPEEKE